MFVAGFPALLMVDSAVRYARDGHAWVESARGAGLREALADATTALVMDEVSRDRSLAPVDRVFVRAGIDHVLTATWFDDSIRSVHAAAVISAAGAARTADVDLEGFKRALEVRLGIIGERADDTCRQLFGAAPCADRGQAQQLIDHYRRRAQRAIARIPDRLLLWPDAGGLDLRVLASLRWIGAALVLASAIALGVVNWRRPAALGAVLAAGAGLFLAGVLAVRLAASGPVARFLLERAGIRESADQPVGIAARGLRLFTSEVVADATRGGMIAAAVLLAAGVGMAVLARRRAARDHREPATRMNRPAS